MFCLMAGNLYCPSKWKKWSGHTRPCRYCNRMLYRYQSPTSIYEYCISDVYIRSSILHSTMIKVAWAPTRQKCQLISGHKTHAVKWITSCITFTWNSQQPTFYGFLNMKTEKQHPHLSIWSVVKFEFKLEQYNSLVQNYAQQLRYFFFYKRFLQGIYMSILHRLHNETLHVFGPRLVYESCFYSDNIVLVCYKSGLVMR